MIIHFLKEEGLSILKANIKNNIEYYRNSPTNDWIYKVFDGENPFQEFKCQVDDFVLDTSASDNGEVGKQEVENIRRLYGAMKNITDTQATDERLWTGLAHCDFWYYLYKRWAGSYGDDDKKNEENIRTRYFLAGNSGLKRRLIVNPISKLWWLGRLTYDQKRKDPFELTSYFSEDYGTKSLILFSSNYMNNAEVARGIISALIDLEKLNKEIGLTKRDLYYKASQYLNVFGGTHILDFYSESEIRNRVIRHIYSLVSKEPPSYLLENNIAGADLQQEATVINEPAKLPENEHTKKKIKNAIQTPIYSRNHVENVKPDGLATSVNDILNELQTQGFVCVDSREKSSIIWVYFDFYKKDVFKQILAKHNLSFVLEKRGAVATNGKPAWRVKC